MVRCGKVSLSRVEFNLTPESLDEIQVRDEGNIEHVYQTAYHLVYPGQQPDSLYRHKNVDHRLREISDEAGCSLRLYIICCMLARRTLAQDAKFYSNYLFARNSAKLVEEFGDMAREQYGAFDYEALGKLTQGGDKLTRDSQRLRDSEVLAGRWLVGYKVRRAGSPLPVFYAENELKLDPVWLSLEPSYVEFHNQLEGISDAISDHRMEVRRVRRWLGKHRHVAVSYFEQRSRLFSESVAEVLHTYGFSLDDFEGPTVIHDAMQFWGRLALAIQHVSCLRLAGVIDHGQHLQV